MEEVSARTARLARAAHLTARLVSGLVADGRGNWLPHTWLEVLVNGRWVGIDPARAVPVTAAYLRLVAGRAAPPLELLALKARLDPRILNVQ
jgi:transglutaminase-like putative cysteine protease